MGLVKLKVLKVNWPFDYKIKAFTETCFRGFQASFFKLKVEFSKKLLYNHQYTHTHCVCMISVCLSFDFSSKSNHVGL